MSVIDIKESAKFFESKAMAEDLEKVYNAIPSGMCMGCTNCCNESVPAFYGEFVNIYNYLTDQGRWEEFKLKGIKHYLLELVKDQKCFFLSDDNRCAIYPVRPHTCRLFGHDSKAVYEEDYDEILENNLEAKDYFEQVFQIVIPDEVVYKKIPYCESFCSDKPLSAQGKAAIIDGLFSLDSKFLFQDLMDEDMINIGLNTWFAYSHFQEDELDEIRLKVSKIYQEKGQVSNLDQMIIID